MIIDSLIWVGNQFWFVRFDLEVLMFSQRISGQLALFMATEGVIP